MTDFNKSKKIKNADSSDYDITEENSLQLPSDQDNAFLRNGKSNANVVLELHDDEYADDITILEDKSSKQKPKKEKIKKEKSFKKQTLLKQLRTLGILLVLGVFTGSGLGVWYYNTELRMDINYDLNADDYKYDINAVMSESFGISNSADNDKFLEKAQEQGKTPLDLSAANNFAIAEYHASLASSWSAVGEGQIKTIITQSMYSEKKFDGEKYTFVSISNSSMVKVANCDEFIKGGKNVSSYSGKNSTANSAEWSKNKEQSLEDYLDAVGTSPTAIQPYIISDKTILSASEISYDAEQNHYTFTIELDTVTSVINYVKQVKFTGGLQSYPKFNKISQTITIDGEWNLVSIEINDQYDAVVGIKASCTGYLKNYYTFNQPIEMPV